jgi:hypothetical protein
MSGGKTFGFPGIGFVGRNGYFRGWLESVRVGICSVVLLSVDKLGI